MPKGRPLTDEERKEIYEARMAGESRAEIARAYGVAPTSVTAIVRKWRERENDMAAKNLIVSGNKKTGRLVSTTNPHRYEGTCVISGKAHSKTFTADDAREAERMWNEWCAGLTTPKKDEPQPKNEVVTPVPHKETPVIQKEEPVVKRESTSMNPSVESVYIIWASGEKPRPYGAYWSMEEALREVDSLNEIASFLMDNRVFEVEEVAFKSREG